MLVGAAQLSAQVLTAVTSNNIAFGHQQNSFTAPQPQTIRVLSSPSGQPFTATATTTGGGNWLLANFSTSATGTTGTSTQDIQVSVSPLGLVTGTYSGQIAVNIADANPDIIGVPGSQIVAGTTPNPFYAIHPKARLGDKVSTPFQRGVAFAVVIVTAGVLTWMGMRNRQCGWNRQRSNTILDVFETWATTNAEMSALSNDRNRSYAREGAFDARGFSVRAQRRIPEE